LLATLRYTLCMTGYNLENHGIVQSSGLRDARHYNLFCIITSRGGQYRDKHFFPAG